MNRPARKASAGAQPGRARTPAAPVDQQEAGAKQEFLREFGHDQQDHERRDLTTELRRTIDPSRCGCGWRWCDRDATPSARPLWSELLKALRALRARGIDPNGTDGRTVVFVGLAFGRAEVLARERGVHDEFHDASIKMLALLAHLGAKDVRVKAIHKALEEVEPMRAGAHAARPEGQHGGVKVGFRAALEAGHDADWDYRDVGAALLLLGLEPGTLKEVVDRARHHDDAR